MDKDTTEVLAGFLARFMLILFFTWMVMLAVGNFGFPQFGFAEALPVGAVFAFLRNVN
jgi:hypothetical protein